MFPDEKYVIYEPSEDFYKRRFNILPPGTLFFHLTSLLFLISFLFSFFLFFFCFSLRSRKSRLLSRIHVTVKTSQSIAPKIFSFDATPLSCLHSHQKSHSSYTLNIVAIIVSYIFSFISFLSSLSFFSATYRAYYVTNP